jgi:hypothetical protein
MKEELEGIEVKLYSCFLNSEKFSQGRALPSKTKNFKPPPRAIQERNPPSRTLG